MTDERSLRAGSRQSSVTGLQAAGVLELSGFDAIGGPARVVYTPAYLWILRSGMLQFADPAFVGALLIADPVAMRICVRSTSALLAEEGTADPPSPKWRRRPKETR